MSGSLDDADTVVSSAVDQAWFSESTQTIDGSSNTVEQSLALDSSVAALDPYSNFLSAFLFDEAKASVEKQVVQLKNSVPAWGLFLQLTANMTLAERQYTNLSFLAPKGFLRKESNLRSTFEHFRVDLQKFADTDLASYANELIFFVSIRMDQMDFYEKLSLLGTAKNVEIEDLITEYEVITEKYRDRTKTVLGGIRLGFRQIFTSLGWEIETLGFLLKSHSSMQKWDFFTSLIYNQEAQKRLSKWAEFLQLSQSSKKSSFLVSGFVNPALYTWLVKLKATLLSKFSLYFYDILTQYSNPMFDVKMVSAKLQMDYYTKISAFVKKSDALAICLIFDAREAPFYPNGYSFPARPEEPPTGLGSFPSILAVPQKPGTHWPSVVMLLNDHFVALNADKLVAFFDPRAQTTYFILKVDVLMYLLAVYEVKKSEKDSQINKFMLELATDLKCGKIFMLLKTIAK